MHLLWRTLLSVALVLTGLLPGLGLATGSAQAAELAPRSAESDVAVAPQEVIRGFTVTDADGIPFLRPAHYAGLEGAG